MECNGIKVKAIWPSQNSVVNEYPREKRQVTQRLDHNAALLDHVREVPLTFLAVRKSNPKPKRATRFD
jgi:hypothetical protein